MRTSPRTRSWRRGLHAGLAGLVLTVGAVALVGPAADAQTGEGTGGPPTEASGEKPRRPQLTDEQRACLEEQGVTKPADGQRPSEEQREAFRDAAERCGIELPHRGPKLTDEQKACLEEAGVEKPAKGQRPTDEQRAAFEAAAEQCGIDLPERAPQNGGKRSGGDAPDARERDDAPAAADLPDSQNQ